MSSFGPNAGGLSQAKQDELVQFITNRIMNMVRGMIPTAVDFGPIIVALT